MLYINYISITLIILLFLLSTLIYKRLRVWKLVITILTLGIFLIAEFFSDLLVFSSGFNLGDYVSYYFYLIVVVLAVNYKNKIKITQNLTDYDFFELEKELEKTRDSSELLRKRFINTISLLNDGLIFYDDDKNGLFVTDEILNIIKHKNPQMTIEEYLEYFHPEDRSSYQQALKKVGRKIPEFEQKYRLNVGNTYTWVEEKGKIFTHNNVEHLLSVIKKIDIKLYPRTSIEIVDSLPNEDDLTNQIALMRKEKKTFYLAMMHLTNIPDINKRFGRDVGNLMIAEYIKQMKFHYARENKSIFRITGIQFAVIIDDEQRYANLHRALVSGGDLINVRINIGGILQIVYPNIGIIKNDPWQNVEISEFISLSNKALEEAIRNNKQNYSIFGG